ncbi:hypothetical protein D3C74_144740 [compost metagenome]
MIRVKMSFAEFRTLDKQSISWQCVQPLTMQVRGQNFEVKQALVDQLNEAQLSTFMFYVYHNHIGSAAELYWFTQYYITDIKAWPAIKAGVRFYSDQVMSDILEEAEGIVVQRNQKEDGSWCEAKPSDLEQDEGLSRAIQAVYDKYVTVSPRLIETMNAYVSQHLNEFIELV